MAEEEKETPDEKRARLVKEQARLQLQYNPTAVDVILSEEKTVKGLFTRSDKLVESFGETMRPTGTITLVLFIDDAVDFIEGQSIVKVGDFSYRVMWVLPQPNLYLTNCYLASENKIDDEFEEAGND